MTGLGDLPGVAPIRSLLEDPDVSEILINGPHRIFVERGGRMRPVPLRFRDDDELKLLIDALLRGTGRSVSTAEPCVDFARDGGLRVNVVLPPVSLGGASVTIRKHSPSIGSVEDLMRLGTLNEEMAAFLTAAVRNGENLVFTGATGTGKTTTLAVLSAHIPAEERIVVIEDTAELRLDQPHVVRLQTRNANAQGAGEVTIRDLFRNSLRMRPDRILLGEIRGVEAVDLVQAIASGHQGCLAVLHASSPSDALARFEVLMLQAGLQLSLEAIHRQLAQTIDWIVQHARLPDGTRRITHVTGVSGLENGRATLEDRFVF